MFALVIQIIMVITAFFMVSQGYRIESLLMGVIAMLVQVCVEIRKIGLTDKSSAERRR